VDDQPNETSLLAWLFSLADDDGVEPNKTAAILHVKPATLATWRSQGKGPRYRKAGRYIDYPAGFLKQYLHAGVRTPEPASVRRQRSALGNARTTTTNTTE
jgi:hypothetical protein